MPGFNFTRYQAADALLDQTSAKIAEFLAEATPEYCRALYQDIEIMHTEPVQMGYWGQLLLTRVVRNLENLVQDEERNVE